MGGHGYVKVKIKGPTSKKRLGTPAVEDGVFQTLEKLTIILYDKNSSPTSVNDCSKELLCKKKIAYFFSIFFLATYLRFAASTVDYHPKGFKSLSRAH